MGNKLDAPPIDAVHIGMDFNATAVQRPPRGWSRGWRNELVLGLPLLCALSRAELACVIGHELAHIAGGHGKSSYLVWRRRRIWWDLSSLIHASRLPGQRSLQRFVDGVISKIDLRCAALSRHQEYEADAAELRIAGRSTARDVHMRIVIGSAFTDAFFEGLWTGKNDEPYACGLEPEPFRELSRLLPGSVTWTGARGALEHDLGSATEAWHTHPATADRVAAISATPTLPQPVIEPAVSLLGGELDEVIEFVDHKWRTAHAEELRKHRLKQAKLAALGRHTVKACRSEGCEQGELNFDG